MVPGRIVLLNGASSSGKSSIARELQKLLPAAHLHVQLDAFRAMEPEGYFRKGQPEVSALRVQALCRAINATCAAYARHGQHVLLDHVLPEEGWRWLAEDLRGLPVLLVGVQCRGDVLQQRECARGDRPPGLAASQVDRIHADRLYDFVLDTSEATAIECAGLLAEWLAGDPSTEAFDAIAIRQG